MMDFMSIRFRCWYCNRRFVVADHLMGECITCNCTHQLRVPRHNGGNCRLKSITDWIMEGIVYSGGGALLRLTARADILAGGNSGPAVVLEKPSESLLVDTLSYQNKKKMPPRGKLPQAQIDILTRWVQMGLPWATTEGKPIAKRHGPPPVDDQARNFWSFRPVQRPQLPSVRRTEWARNPIDYFVLAKLEAADITPAKPAGKESLLRRVYYDLIGLPPTPEEVDAFLADHSPDAYEKVVDRLLASPRYGERWARHWLDVVRYAESNSFERDGAKPFVWRY